MVPKVLAFVSACSVLSTPVLASGQAQPSTPSGGASEWHDIRSLGDAASHQGVEDKLALFTPTKDPVRHTIDYEIWDWALKNIVIAMGPSNRKTGRRPDPGLGTRIKQGPQSRYRFEGSLVLFRFFDREIIDSFTAYRQDLEQVTETLNLSALPRNEQLAFWLNLHNVALLEQLSREWPLREPREVEIDGVPLDEARFITVRGVPVSLRDIRENIVFRNWKDPKVIYGFWRGEIGGPELQRYAFTGANVGSLLDVAAVDFVNSLRGTQQNGDRLEVARLYAEVAPFYFADFDTDLRAHLNKYAESTVAELLSTTSSTRAVITETAIADLHGGARPANYLFVGSLPGADDDPLIGCSNQVGQAVCTLLEERATKLQTMKRRGQPTGRVFFSNIDLPGDPPNKNAVE